MIQERLIKENGCVAICDNTKISKPEWLEKRRSYINGTDAGKIAGVCHWGNPVSVFLDKTIQGNADNKEPANWFKLKVGHIFEPLIAEWYEKITGYKVEPVTLMLRHPTIPFIAGDLDYIAETPAGELIGLEMKTTEEINIYDQFRAGILGNDAILPKQYEYQVRHYMAVTGINRFIVLVCYGFDASKVIPITVYRDENIEEELIQMETDFWKNHILTGIQPEGGMRKDDLNKVQKHLFRSDKEQELQLGEEADMLLSTYEEFVSEKKQKEAEIKQIEGEINCLIAEICALSKGAPLATRQRDDDTYYEISNKVSSRTTADSEALRVKYPEVWDECKKVSSFEQTTIKVKKIKKKGGK